MRNWLPRPAAERKFQVAVKPTKLEEFAVEDDSGHQKFVCIKVKWKGEAIKFLPLIQRSSTQKKEFSSEKILKKGRQVIRWDDDKWFENTCCFSVLQNHSDPRFGPWEVVLDILCVEKMGSKAKTAVVVGRVSVNIAEIAWKLEKSWVAQKIPVILKIERAEKEAFLTVLFSFAEITEPREPRAIISGRSIKPSEGGDGEIFTGRRRREPSREEVIDLDESDELSTTFLAAVSAETTSRSNPIPINRLDSYEKEGWFSWKNRGLISFKRAKTEENTFDKTETCSNRDITDYSFLDSVTNPVLQNEDLTNTCLESDDPHEESTSCAWEDEEFISRDGKTKVKAGVLFASFDQRSDKANGGSACAALALVISHWLNLNKDEMPNRLEFDNLIKQGSSEWRKLCENADHVRDFPNKHFDLETVLRADIRPISVLHEKSFIGFFGAEKFESLKGSMSFDEIWNEITSNVAVKDIAPRIYIVSWHEHFFVLKAEENAYYIIDTLGERLFEGCNQAYMLKFDDSAVLTQIQPDKETTNQPRTENTNSEEATEAEKIICSGKECCREFIKRFLAAIPLQELEEEEKKKGVSYFSLYRRLQIEFNYSCYSDSDTSSLMSSIFSSPNHSTSSSFTNEGFDPEF